MGIILSLTLLLIAGGFAVAIAMALRENGSREWRFELARVLSDALSAIATAPMIFIGTVVATTGLPISVLMLARVAGGISEGSQFLLLAIGGIGMMLVGQMGQMVMVAAALEAVAGRQPSLPAILRSVVPLLPQGLALTILWWIVVMIGFSFFLVPGVILMCLWFAPTAALVAERRGVIAALSRSAELTRGARWRIFLLLCIGAVFWLVMQSFLGIVAAAMGDSVAATIVFAVFVALMGMLPPAVTASAFHTLRQQKEGPDTRELKQVFA